MRTFLIGVFLLSLLQFPAQAAECTLCVGVVGSDGTAVPALTRLDEQSYPTFSPVNAANVSVLIEYEAADVTAVEEKTKQILDWARSRGPFDSIGVSVRNADATLGAYAIKRLAVSAQGEGIAKRILVARDASLPALVDAGANAYFDAVITDAADVEQTFAFFAERDPSKKIFAVVPVTSPNPLFDLAG